MLIYFSNQSFLWWVLWQMPLVLALGQTHLCELNTNQFYILHSNQARDILRDSVSTKQTIIWKIFNSYSYCKTENMLMFPEEARMIFPLERCNVTFMSISEKKTFSYDFISYFPWIIIDNLSVREIRFPWGMLRMKTLPRAFSCSTLLIFCYSIGRCHMNPSLSFVFQPHSFTLFSFKCPGKEGYHEAT